jgi:hypothetical protein
MLTIQSVGYRHSGLYTCVAKNSAGTASSAVQLKVNGRQKQLVNQERERKAGIWEGTGTLYHLGL